ncbi:MAG: hypothetical protein ACJASG_001221 [Oleiphilaceae bacterium]|jgi:hypothetical protein
MDIGSVSNSVTIAPGTANSPVRPETDLNFEESNKAVLNPPNRVNDAQETQQTSQDVTSQTTVNQIEAQLQQNNIERSIESSTDQEVNTSSLPTTSNATQTQQTNQLANSLSDVPLGRDDNNLQDQLQERINNIVSEGNQPQSQLDILA